MYPCMSALGFAPIRPPSCTRILGSRYVARRLSTAWPAGRILTCHRFCPNVHCSTIEFNKPYGTPCNIEPLSTSRRGQDPHGRKCNSYRSPSLKPKLHQKEARSTERSHFCNRSTVKYYGTPCRKIAILT